MSALKLLRIGSFNLYYRNSKQYLIPSILNQNNIDVALLLETSADYFEPQVFNGTPFRAVVSSSQVNPSGIALVAQSDIEITAKILPAPFRTDCPHPFVIARLNTGKRCIGILGVHPPPPGPGCSWANSRGIQAFAKLVSKGKLVEDTGPAHKGDDAILLGDLNALPFFSSLRKLRRSGLEDTMRSKNWLANGTWRPFPAVPRLARIDYIFASRQIPVRTAFCIPIPGSDHHGVCAEIAL